MSNDVANLEEQDRRRAQDKDLFTREAPIPEESDAPLEGNQGGVRRSYKTWKISPDEDIKEFPRKYTFRPTTPKSLRTFDG